MTLEEWLNKSFTVLGKTGDELKIKCPKCDGTVFFFNLEKKVGCCHKASCGWTPTVKDLNVLARTKIGTSIHSEAQHYQAPPKPIEIPVDALPLVELIEGQYRTKFERASQEVYKRGVTFENQYRFKLTFDGQRVYIPVYEDGKLVNFVGRAAWWKELDIPRYKYPKGASTRDTLFNWDEMKLRDSLVLVENTFNGIWLMDRFNATSNFGSDLSLKQIDKIKLSHAKKVIILWDEGADKLASRAVGRLRKLSVPAIAISITGQPDNYSVETIEGWIHHAMKNVNQIDKCIGV